MSRTKIFIALGGVALMAGAAGWACGLLTAPASGAELRRRLSWRAEEEWRTAARAGRAFVGRAVSRAKAELDRRQARVRETMAD
ncbi:MAG: YtxH domain-containing protein [Acidobacteria bacterium]|nr:YtxH domain-containing protein [Acidobacteriota bacterium]